MICGKVDGNKQEHVDTTTEKLFGVPQSLRKDIRSAENAAELTAIVGRVAVTRDRSASNKYPHGISSKQTMQIHHSACVA